MWANEIKSGIVKIVNHKSEIENGGWLPDMDLNHDKQIQSLLCYRYTIGQDGVSDKLKNFVRQSSCSWLYVYAVIIFTSCVLPVSVHAQFYNPIILDASMTKFFEDSNAFSGTMEITSRDAGKILTHVAVLKGMTRVEMDITQTEPQPTLQEMKDYYSEMKKVGTAESVNVFNPSGKFILTILPKLKVCLQAPIPDEAIGQLQKKPKRERVELGKETIAGHPCTKYKLTFNSENMDVWRTWETPSAIVWNADDLNGCPLRIEVIDSIGATNSTLVFKDIKTNEPASSLFEAPDGFKKFDNSQAFMTFLNEKWPKQQ
jgi:hypothetical protein